MKKIAALTVISSLIFFSCASNKIDNADSLTDSVNPVESSSSEQDETSDIIEETQKSETEPEAETQLTEETESEAEAVAVTEIEDVYIPEEEKVDDEDIKSDLSLLEDELTEEKNQSSEEEKIAAADTESENSKQAEIKKEEPKPAQVSVKTETKDSVPSPKTAPVQKEPPAQKTSPAPSKTESTQEPENSFDLQKEASEAAEKINASEDEKPPVPSRTMTIKNNQYLDINYPGKGWVYLGEVERKNLLVFYGRKVNDDSTTFTLQSRKSGTAILHFYKNDNLSGKYIDDYVEVTINAESATDNSHAVTPDYAKIVPPKPQKPQPPVAEEETSVQKPETENRIEYKPVHDQTQNTKPADPDLNIQTIIQNANAQAEKEEAQNQSDYFTPASDTGDSTASSSTVQTPVSGDLLEEARKAYNDKKYPEALTLVRTYLSDASTRIDEGIFLEAQILEANSSVQNIKEAIKDYDTVVKNWTQSKLWKQAKDRSIYLKRFYIDIR